jgi:integrase
MRYMLEKKGRYYFNPTPAMKKVGFGSIPLGSDHIEAKAKVSKLNAEWDKIRGSGQNPEKIRGDFNWIIRAFQNDPIWYGEKAIRTQDEIDYAFSIIAKSLGEFQVKAFARRHGRAFYNRLLEEGASLHKGRKVMKWFRRLMRYAQEIGVRDDNPLSDMMIGNPKGRNEVWTKEELESIVALLLSGGKAPSGNVFPARPSIALAALIAYDTSLPQQDILALQWDQFDGQGLDVTHKKKRGGKPVWLPLTTRTIAMIKKIDKKLSPYIIVSEENKQPYLDANPSVNRSRCRIFSKNFRRFRERAGIERGLTFHDLRRTAMTELGNAGATNAEIVAFSGHSVNSRVLDVYVKPDQTAARSGAKKRKRKSQN